MYKHLLCALAVIALVSLAFAGPLADEDADLKKYEEKYNEAKKLVEEARRNLENDYVSNFSKILEDGLENLNKKTEDVAKNEKDAAKRKAAITFGIESCDRLIRFIKEIEEKMQ